MWSVLMKPGQLQEAICGFPISMTVREEMIRCRRLRSLLRGSQRLRKAGLWNGYLFLLRYRRRGSRQSWFILLPEKRYLIWGRRSRGSSGCGCMSRQGQLSGSRQARCFRMGVFIMRIWELRCRSMSIFLMVRKRWSLLILHTMAIDM